METIEIFQILGIEATKDERAIKNAYREKLAVTNPEDNPEGFKRLRTAYEEACNYARQSDEDKEEEQRDTTPSGLWAEKAAAVYHDITARRDVKQWETLFEDDIFLSLEEEENCRLKLLRFLMDNFKLPTAVWKLLDKKINIVSDAADLRERFPADFIRYIVSKCERGEDVEFDQFEGAPDAPYDLYLQYYDRCWNAIQEKNYEQAAEYIKNADELQIFHPVMEVCRAHLLVEQQNIDEAVERMEKLRERFPKDAMVCYNAAEIMWHHDRKEKAAEIYQGLKKENDSHYMANVRLTEWYYEQGQYQEAKKCAEKVLSSGADDNFMELLTKVNQEIEKELEEHYLREKDCHSGLELGWCYLQDGKVSRGIQLVESLEKDVPEDRLSEYKGLLTKLYMEETEYEQAAAVAVQWEKALQKRLVSDESEEEKEKDRDRVRQYHIIRMQCYRAQGDMKSSYKPETCREYYEKAIAEAESMENGTSQDIGLLLEKAQIYMEMEEYEKSLDVTRRLIEEYQVYAAYATETEVYRRQWNAAGVVQSGRQCINYFPTYVRTYEHVAKVFLDLERREDLEQLLEEAKKNGVTSVILDAYRYQMMRKPPETEVLDQKLAEFRKEYFSRVEKGDMGAYEKGLPILTEYLYWYPGTYMLVERGLFHRAAHHYEEAKADFEKALSENPCQPYALNGLSFVYKYMGDYEKALIFIKRAIRYRDPDMSDIIYADMANLYSLLGNYQGALKAYKKFANYNGYKSQYHMRRLAICMARCGELDNAIQTLKSAFSEDMLAYYEEAVEIFQAAGCQEKAEENLKAWNAMMQNIKKTLNNGNYADYYTNRAFQELLFGDGAQAMAYFDKVAEYGAHDQDPTEDLCDAVFAAILCGDDKRGRNYAAKLRLYLAKAKSEGRNDFVNADKSRLQLEFLADYYRASSEELEKILDAEKDTEICHYCDQYICKEMEGVRILYLLRMGRTKEAMDRLEANLEKMPMNEYMRAIRHMCENGVLVTPDAQIRASMDRKGNSASAAGNAEITEASQTEKNGQENGLISRLKGMFGRNKK